MVIAGAGGLGIEIMGFLILDGYNKPICFYDDNKNRASILYNKFPVYHKSDELITFFNKNGYNFITGIGNPRIREKLTKKIIGYGGKLTNAVSLRAAVFPYTDIPPGVIIQPGAALSHGIELSEGDAIHINCTIGHNTKLGKYVNIGPNVSVIGPVEICDYAYIGAHSTIMPGIKIGKQAIIPAGSYVNRNVADYETFGENNEN
ncbi:MAG: dTDP-4-amino-4,6-dideoxy-D-glucose acetyltransferase VioB [Marinilabiliales bacterium]